MSPPRRNRVDPFGTLAADPARGGLFGNRGCLHDEQGEIRRHHRGPRWIYCRLEFKGRRRELLQPGRFTELFFLDEATALAAGHRPCMECMRDRAVQFRDAWAGANPDLVVAPPRVTAIDAVLQCERIDRSGRKRTFEAPLAELPGGTMVVSGGFGPVPHLLEAGRLRRWSFSGYGEPLAAAPGAVVEVLTPRSVVRTLAAGFAPGHHAG